VRVRVTSRVPLFRAANSNQPEVGCAASRGGGRPPNCAYATPGMVIAAPAIFSQVKVSPRVSQAITPATGGIRYMKGALRATPRTLFTQVQSSQPTNEQTTSAQNSAAQTAGPKLASRNSLRNGKVKASMTGIEKSSV